MFLEGCDISPFFSENDLCWIFEILREDVFDIAFVCAAFLGTTYQCVFDPSQLFRKIELLSFQ